MKKKKPNHSERMFSTHSKTVVMMKEEKKAQICICNVYILLRKPHTTNYMNISKFIIIEIHMNILIFTKHSNMLLFTLI